MQVRTCRRAALKWMSIRIGLFISGQLPNWRLMAVQWRRDGILNV